MIKGYHRAFRDLPINKKLLIAYASIFLITMLLGSTVLYSLVRSTIEDNIESELNNTTTTILSMVQTAAKVSIKNHLRAAAEQNREILEHIHGRQQAGVITEAAARAEAREMLLSQTIGRTGYIYCVDSRGIAPVHPRPGVEGGSFLQHEFVREQILRKEGYLEYEWKNPGETGERPKALYMTYFAPWDWIISVSSYREEFAELIDVSDFRDSILALRFGETGYSFVINSRGNLIIHPKLSGSALDFADAWGRDFVRTLCEKKRGKMVYSWKNPGEETFRDKLVMFNYLPDYDWIVASSCYLEESYAPLRKIRNVILATVAAMFVLAFPITWLLSVYIVKPMKKLMENFRKGATGDLSVRMDDTPRDEMGELAGYFNYFMKKLESSNSKLRDEVRERQQAESELRFSEEKYRTILERMEEGYYEVDPDGRFVFFNESLEGILGYSKKTLTGLNIREISEPKTSRQIFDTFREIRHSGQPVKTASCELIRGDGSKCFLETSISPIEGQNGHIAGYRGVLKDVTEKKRAERALRRSEEMFSKAFRSSPSGIFIVTVREHRIVDVNDSFLRFTGFVPADIIGRSIPDIRLFVPEEKNIQIMDRLLKDNHIRSMEVDFCGVTGDCRMGILSAEILDLRGERCMLAALEDVTDTRRLEREILDISEREHQRMGRTLHDDLCPHLLGVEVLSKVLRKKLAEKSIPESERAARIQSLIRDSIGKLKGLSRGLYPLDLSGNEFDAAIADLARHTREIFGVDCLFQCDIPVSIRDDTAAIHAYYIAHEALHNAIKHSGARSIRISLTSENGTTRLTIQDDGTGIQTMEASRGMGMRIMSYRARRIGAELQFYSDPAGGTAVTLKMKNPAPCECSCDM